MLAGPRRTVHYDHNVGKDSCSFLDKAILNEFISPMSFTAKAHRKREKYAKNRLAYVFIQITSITSENVEKRV